MIQELNSTQFKEKIQKGTIIIKIGAIWCGPCKQLDPILEDIEASKQFPSIFKIDADKEGELMVEFGIMSVPTIIIFKDGNAIGQKTGMTQKDPLIKWFEAVINGKKNE